MIFSSEKEFVKRNYLELLNNKRHCYDDLKNIFSYSKKNNETAMITLDIDEVTSTWHFSYPMKNQGINYTTSFNSRQDVDKYIEYILKNELLE